MVGLALPKNMMWNENTAKRACIRLRRFQLTLSCHMWRNTLSAWRDPIKPLAENKINILAISTSEIKISVLIGKKYTELGIKSLHSVYKLDKK